MRWTSVVCLCMLAVHLASSYPLEDTKSTKLETISTLEENIGHPTSEHSDREKRTIGFLRQLFPGLSKIIDDKIQQLTSVIFRIVGRFVLRGGALGGGGGGGGGGNSDSSSSDGGSRRISITLPTYPPDEDDEDETEAPAETSSLEPSTESNDIAQEKVKEGESRRKREAPAPKPEADLATDESEKKDVQVPVVPDNNDNKIADKVSDKADADEDVEGAESEKEEISNDAEEAEPAGESNTRNKRLGVLGSLFGGGGRDSSGSGSSGGGSGNFLFDIIRLVAGSGATEQQDENANGPIAPGADGQAAVSSDDGYQAGIPGPITRLFVIANRGIANLIQDLILRLAQTSERIVNFKARLITAII